ncbi:hypothetical protein OESDEN_13853, partial [Oesophagostomum dentatum]
MGTTHSLIYQFHNLSIHYQLFALVTLGEAWPLFNVHRLVISRPQPNLVTKVRVELSENAKQHFIDSKRVFEDSVEIRVEEPLMMRQPNLPVPIIRLAQNTEMQLETAWPQSVVEYSVPPEFARRLSVTKSGRVRARSITGPAAVVIHRTDLPDNETSIVPITVAGVDALDVMLTTKLEPATSTTLMHLPVGAKIVLKVVFRDSKGREITASSKISYRPHRFDLTEIVPSDSNRTLTITLKSAGETVLKIWDTVEPTQNVYIRLSAAEMFYPLTRRPIVSDIVCFTSPLGCTEEQLAAMSSVRAPFECIASFSNNKIGPAVNILSTKAVFSPKLGSYACVIESQEAGQIRLDITGASQMDLNLVAKWSSDSQIREAATTTVFHMAMHVVEEEASFHR